MGEKKKMEKMTGAMAKKPAPTMPGSWYLLSRRAVTVRELQTMLPGDADIEIWTEAGVLELGLGSGESMDVEEIELESQEPETLEYFREEGVLALYYISFKPALYEKALPYLRCLAAGTGSPICADTDSFTPVIEG